MLAKATLFFLSLLPVSFLVSMAAMEAISWTLFLLFLLHLGLDFKAGRFRGENLKSGAEWPLWGFFVVTSISAIFMVPDAADVVDIIGDNRWILLLYAYIYLLRKYLSEEWQKLVPYFGLLVAVVGLYSVVQFFTGLEVGRSHSAIKQMTNGYFRSAGFFSLPLTFAANIGMAAFVLAGFAWVRAFGRSKTQVLGASFAALIFGSIMGFAGVIASFTRGAWLAAASASVFAGGLVKKRVAFVIFIGLVLAVGSAYALVPTFQKRIQSVFASGNRSNNLRFLIWEANWEMGKDHPWLGIGLHQNGTEKYLYDYYGRIGASEETFKGHAHNNFLQIWVGTGIFGLLFFVWFCFEFLKKSYVLYRRGHQSIWMSGLGLGGFAAQIHLHVGGLTECNFTDGEVTHMLIFLWALTTVSLARASFEPGQNFKLEQGR